MSNLQFLSKKRIDHLGSTMNEAAGSKMSAFAMNQMLKMGWTEGSGLGKSGEGISSHIKVSFHAQNEGISSKEEKEVVVDINGHASTDDQWWHSAFQSNAKKFRVKASNSSDTDSEVDKKKKKKDKKEKKAKKEKKERRKEKDTTDGSNPSYEDLFKATGGARLGMRARMNQVGKISRTEGDSSDISKIKRVKTES